MHAAAAYQELIGDPLDRRVVRGAQVCHELVSVDELPRVEVAHVRCAADGHRAGDEVVIAAAKVVQALVLIGWHRHDRVDGGAAGTVAGLGGEGEGDEHGGRGEAAHSSRLWRRGASHKPAARRHGATPPLTLPGESSRRAVRAGAIFPAVA